VKAARACIAAVAVALAGCGAAPRVGDTLTLQGTLVFKGNEPVVTPVLVSDASVQWELQQVAPAAAASLQNRKVQATGVVTRTPGTGVLPALRVTDLRQQ
jgi:hypothetical protein